MGHPSPRALLAQMPLSDYWRMVARVQKVGLASRAQTHLLQQLNANVLNASGRYSQAFSAQDFGAEPVQATSAAADNAVVLAILGDVSTLSFEPNAQ